MLRRGGHAQRGPFRVRRNPDNDIAVARFAVARFAGARTVPIAVANVADILA